jgi:hypothetical protein
LENVSDERIFWWLGCLGRFFQHNHDNSLLFFSLVTRRFFQGAWLVLVTMALTLFVVLIGLGSGMALGDFKPGVVLPYVMLGMVIAAMWLFGMKVHGH